MKELLEKYDEALFRLGRLSKIEPDEKIQKAEVIYANFRSYIDEKYPLHVLGNDHIVEVLRQRPAEQYGYKIVDGIIEFPASKEQGQELVSKAHVDETLSAISFNEKLKDQILNYESDLAFQDIQEQLDKIDTKEAKLEFLMNFKFGEEIKALPQPDRINWLIDDAIVSLEGGVKEGEVKQQSFQPHLKLGPGAKTKMVELIDALGDARDILDKHTDAPVKLGVLIKHFEFIFDEDLAEYYNIRRHAFLSHKRDVEGRSYFKRLDELQKLKIEELKSKGGKK